MNAINFIRETAEFMAKDRPDLYDVETAISDLVQIMESMRGVGESTWTSFASYILMLHYEDEDVEDWNFTRKISSMTLFEEEEEMIVVGYTEDSGVLTQGVDLPGPGEIDLDL